MKKSLLSLLVALFLVSGAGALTGCHTTEGVGKDVQGVGEGVERAADRNK